MLEGSKAVLVFEGINGKLKHNVREFFILRNKNSLCCVLNYKEYFWADCPFC